MYEAIKHFRHMFEARHFIIFTDLCLPAEAGQMLATAV
jgi:hypothetical protein